MLIAGVKLPYAQKSHTAAANKADGNKLFCISGTIFSKYWFILRTTAPLVMMSQNSGQKLNFIYAFDN